MVHLYYDAASGVGGVETELHALATKLHRENVSFQVFVSEGGPVPLFDELEEKGVEMHRLPRLPGDRWKVRHRVLMAWLWWHLSPGDWVYSPCPPNDYLRLVRLTHNRGAQIGVRWSQAPEFRPGGERFIRALHETDAVISTSECTVPQFSEVYGYDGPVQVVPLHNLAVLEEPVPLPEGPPWKIGFMGRLDVEAKNLDRVLEAYSCLSERENELEFHFFGSGEIRKVESMASEFGVRSRVTLHGRYDHRKDLPDIMERCHFFVHPSRYEGGPCLSLLELVQAGRLVVASSVGGIPDLYDGHPEAGILVDPNSVESIAVGLKKAVDRSRDGQIAPELIRDRYVGNFDMKSAHAEWRGIFLDGEPAPSLNTDTA
jgi:glycosyltransferase involved in cell wall biosynthesis